MHTPQAYIGGCSPQEWIMNSSEPSILDSSHRRMVLYTEGVLAEPATLPSTNTEFRYDSLYEAGGPPEVIFVRHGVVLELLAVILLVLCSELRSRCFWARWKGTML